MGLDHVPSHPRLQCGEDVLVLRVHREQKRSGARGRLTDGPRRFQPIQERHGQIQDCDVRG